MRFRVFVKYQYFQHAINQWRYEVNFRYDIFELFSTDYILKIHVISNARCLLTVEATRETVQLLPMCKRVRPKFDL